MELGYGTEHEAFRERVRTFLDAQWPPPDTQARNATPDQIRCFRRAAIDAGYLYRNIPRRYGGSEQEPDILAAQIIREEFAALRAPTELTGQGPQMLAPTLLERGSEWQKEHFVRKAIEGEHIWCQGYSEPGAGSDLASLRTTGVLEDGEWVITGQKIWTSHWKHAHYMFALVRTEPEANKHAGISYLLLEMDQPGIEVRPLKQITGDNEFAEVFLDGARTPADWIVGERGEGWSVSRSLLKHERNMIGSANRSAGLFKSLLRLARKVQIDGRPAVEDRGVREALAHIHGYVETQRCSSYVQLTRELQGRDAGTLPMFNKITNTNIGQDISRLSHRLLGAESALAPRGQPSGRSSGNEKWMNQFMGSLGMAIAGGTTNIQRNIIAERGLGLPRDSAAAKTDES
ncbi:MAG: acyl-CoA dehydrogenase [bacterium]|nr:acyl-CoA dehydrogenase [Deltaproteobacteria bacterium]MCP4906173.1 acyl-CoA dehydrogenase [bacterium]